MNLKKWILTCFVVFIVLGIFGLYFQIMPVMILCHILPSIFLSIWFYLEVNHNLNLINRYLIIGVAIGSVSYLSWIIYSDYFYGLFSVFTGTLMLLLLTYVIRVEGVTLVSDKSSNILKVIIPFLIIFSFYGILLLPILPEIPMVFTSIYALVQIVFVSHIFIRKSNPKDYVFTCVGALLLLAKDILFALHFYVLDKQFPFLYILIFVLSPIAIYFLLIGIINQRKVANF